MAVAYSDPHWTGDYTYTRVKVEYNFPNTSATATLLYTRTNTWSGNTEVYGATFSFGGASTSYIVS